MRDGLKLVVRYFRKLAPHDYSSIVSVMNWDWLPAWMRL